MKKERDYKKEFIDLFEQMSQYSSKYLLWEQLMTVFACSISNALENNEEIKRKREKEYEDAIKKINNFNKATSLFALLVQALEENPKQDFLGEIYMNLKLYNSQRGQVFTPYHVSEMMSKITLENAREIVKEKGYISINDPCCGAGVMLIAARNILIDQGINLNNQALFVGQDIDRTVALMAYVQLSLMGCAGYIVIGNSLTEPVLDDTLKRENNESIWKTPILIAG